MTSKKEEAAKAPKSEDLATEDQAEHQATAKKIVDRLSKDRAVEGAPNPYEEAQEMAAEVVDRQHEAQTTVGPTKDD